MRTSPEQYASRAEAQQALWTTASNGRADCTHDRRFYDLVLLATLASLRRARRRGSGAAISSWTRLRSDAFLPDLAAVLNNRSVFLADLERREEALAPIDEALTIRRDLPRVSTVFASRLARSVRWRTRPSSFQRSPRY